VALLLFLFATSPARDDWNNISNFRDIPFTFDGFYSIVANTWCCSHEKRYFFVSMLLQWPISHMGTFAPIFLYLTLGMILFLISQQSVILLRRVFPHSGWAEATAFMFAWSSGSIIVGGWANNIFFVLPILCCVLIIKELFYREIVRGKVALALIFLAEFSGESGLGILLFILVTYLIKSIRSNSQKLPALLYLAFLLLSGVVYNQVLSSTNTKNKAFQLDLEVVKNYIQTFRKQELSIWSFNGYLYGTPSRNFFAFFIILTILLVSFSAFLYTQRASSHPELPKLSALHKRYTVIFTILVLPFIFFPMLIGIISGARLGPDYRYHFPVVILIIFATSFLLSNIGRYSYFCLILFIIVGCYGSASALETRYRQGLLDSQIWSQVHKLDYGNEIDAFITYNPFTNYPMPPYHSFAESDFQADWGIIGKYQWDRKIRVPVYSDIECEEAKCFGILYYGGKDLITSIENRRFVFIMSELKINPKRIQLQDFVITKKYADYADFRKLNPKQG
jgi:hypothetical protein